MTRSTSYVLASFTALSFAMMACAEIPTAEIESYDTNNDKLISGAEYGALAQIKTRMSGSQRVTFEEADPAKGVSVLALSIPQANLQCNLDKRFFLQRDPVGISLITGTVAPHSNKGAKFTLNRDLDANISSWELEGAIAYLPKNSGRCLTQGRERAAQGKVAMTGFATAPYLSFNGSGTSSAKGNSEVSLGVLGQIQLLSGPFDLQNISFTGAYRTDFDWDAEIYSLAALWRPVDISSRINALQNSDRGKVATWWGISADAEYLSVEKAGSSGLTEGEEYFWLGADLAFNIEITGKGNGVYAQFGLDLNHDFINDVTANAAEIRVGSYLSSDKRNSLELSYRKGEERSSLTDVDRLSLNLNFAF